MAKRSQETSEEQTQDKAWDQMNTEILQQSYSSKYCLCWPLRDANISHVINAQRFKTPRQPISELPQALEDCSQAADEGQ